MRIANEGQMQAQEMMPDGQEFLQSSGVPEQYAQWLGPAMDSFIGVPPTIGSAIKLSNAGKPMAALAELASDYALSTPHLWGPPLVQAAKNYSQGKSPWASSTKPAGR